MRVYIQIAFILHIPVSTLTNDVAIGQGDFEAYVPSLCTHLCVGGKGGGKVVEGWMNAGESDIVI